MAMKKAWEQAGGEPSLDDILDDPIARLLMEVDGTGKQEVQRLIARVRAGLGPPGAIEGAVAPSAQPGPVSSAA